MSVRPFSERVELSPLGGTVLRWTYNDRNILFPRQEMEIQGVRKTRGGMHACFPNHGMGQARFNLPQHGSLRDITGVQEGDRVSFENTDILQGPLCRVVVSVRSETQRGFNYRLSAHLHSNEPEPFPTTAGLHPYFATPKGKAVVYVGGEEYKVHGLVENAKRVPFKGDASVYLPGIGLVRIRGGQAFQESKTAQLVIWRDTEEYICVEPTLGTPAGFAQGNCLHLQPGETFDMSCSFKIV